MNTEEQSRFDDFVEFLLQAHDKDALAALLHALLTPAEMREIPNRLKITQMLQQGITQREVAKQLGVGIATVTRGAKAVTEIEKLLESQNDQRNNSKT